MVRLLAPFLLMAAALAALLPATAAQAQIASQANTGLPRLAITVGSQPLRVEVAATLETRMKGLMHREKMAPNDGMLFVFDVPGYHSMWMRNTFIPLSVAFIDAQGRILNIADMEPHSEQNHFAAGPAVYALEMNKGWFRQHGIGPGTQIKGLDKAPKGL